MASKKPSGLGRGLGALLGDDVLKAESTGSLYLPISQVESCSSQPRKHFDEASLAELADSIREHGIIQPLTVRKLASGYYQIIAGERRWRAARLAGLQEVPVIVMEADDRKAAELAMIENLQREDLSPMEEAEGYKILVENYGMTQEQAVQAVCRAIRRARVGLNDPARPYASFLFLGPTGVGKTELCKALAEQLFGSADCMIRLDMSEYMEKHTVSRLVGSPPGYVGFEEGGQLTDLVRRRPYSVVLLDEVEKAHPDVLNLLLQILEEGSLQDAQGRKVSFCNTVIIMTSNIGARFFFERGALGFEPACAQQEDSCSQLVLEELRRQFSPELLNRIDETILFRKLGQPELEQICRKLLQQLSTRIQALDMQLHCTPAALKELCAQGYSPRYGARPLRRAVQRLIEDPAAEMILNGQLPPQSTLLCDYCEQDHQLHLSAAG